MIKAKIFETTKFIQIIFSILILFCSSILFAQESLVQLENPENQQNINFAPLKLIADTNYPVKAISFSQNQNYYAYTISDTIIICNNFTDEVEKVILGHQGQIQQIKFFDYEEILPYEPNLFEENPEYHFVENTKTINAIISYDDSNKAFIFDTETKKEKAKLEFNPLIKLNTISNFQNKFVIAGLDDGNIILTDLNSEIQNQQLIKISENPIINIEYSEDGQNILITDSKGNIFLIYATDYSVLLKVYGFAESCVGAKFNKNSDGFIYQTASDKLTLRNTDGIPIFDITVPSPITDYIWNKDFSKIYVATQNGLIWIYSDKGILEGAIFAENPDKIISMDTDFSNQFLLVGFEKGSLIKLFIKTKFILPEDALKMQSEFEQAQAELENKDSSEKPVKQKILPELPIEDWAIDFNLGISTLPKPYTISVFGGARFIEFQLLNPVSLGVGLNYNFGFPQKDFPYKYYYNSREFHAPFLSEFVPYILVGYNLAPIKNLDFLCSIELKLGVSFLQLWSANLAANLVTSVVPSLYSALGISASFHNWGIFLGGEYNTCLGFGFTTSASYRIDFKRKTIGNKNEKK